MNFRIKCIYTKCLEVNVNADNLNQAKAIAHDVFLDTDYKNGGTFEYVRVLEPHDIHYVPDVIN